MSSIDSFPWDENFNTGLPKVDEQHRKLVRLLNLLASHAASSETQELLLEVFDELSDYAAYHFATEEAIWRQFLANDPAEVEHQAEHRRFVLEIERLKASLASSSLSDVAEDTLGFLVRWLASHILERDRYLAYAVLARQQGLPPEAAKLRARQQMGEATAVLIDIILSMYSTLSANALRLMQEQAEHRRNKQALLCSQLESQAGEANLRTLFDTIDDFLFVLDSAGNILRVNRTVIERLGYAEHQLLGRSVLQLHPEERHAEAIRIVGDMLSGQAEFCEIPLRTVDGSQIAVETKAATGQWNGQPALFGVSRDISQRQQADEALHRSHSLLTAALESTADGLLVVDSDGNVSRFNRRFLELWRIPKQLAETRDDGRLLGFVLEQLQSPQAFIAKVQELYATPEATSWDELTFLDGRVFERYSQPQRIGDKVVGRVWSFRDVTDQKRALEALTQESEKNHALLRNASDGIHILDERGVVIEASDSFCRMLGYQRDEVIGMHVSQWDAIFSGVKLDGKVREQFECAARTQFDTKHRRKDGSIFDVEVSGYPLQLAGRKVLFNSSRDISERNKTAEQLHTHLDELRRWQNVMLDREDRILDLKREVNELLVSRGEAPRYPSVADGEAGS